MRILLDRVLEDLLVLDAGAIEKVWTLDGEKLVALNSVDAATIRPIYNEFGEMGNPAYVQVVEGGQEKVYFERKEMVYMMANPQNDIELFGYGMSPIESIMLQVQAALQADMYNIKNFTKDNIPPGMLDLGDISEEEASNFIALWNATVIGNTQAMKFVW
jgi:phage portal protein BeeE